MVDEKDIEEVVLQYLETRDDGWKWIMGSKVYTKTETVKLFRKDKKFRKFICGEIVKLATDLFLKASEKK